LSQTLDQRLFDAVRGSVRLARTDQINVYDPAFYNRFAVPSKTILLDDQTTFTLGIPRAFKVLIKHHTYWIDIRAIIAYDSHFIGWSAIDQLPAIREVNGNFQPQRCPGGKRCVRDRWR
jgi:hypothetical protein